MVTRADISEQELSCSFTSRLYNFISWDCALRARAAATLGTTNSDQHRQIKSGWRAEALLAARIV